ncbi:MAG: choice-of-anchor tandem repeat GloVer-containing protein [Terriglobales bacterium]|jgi:uncharacterized repeat protein (TIGR03803 family)
MIAKLTLTTLSALALAAISALLLIAARPAHGQTETVLYNFGGSGDGAYPQASLVFGIRGNLYGTTAGGGVYGGPYGYGTVFAVTPSGTEAMLYSLGANGTDGHNPEGGLLRDTKGNLYGTTWDGGVYGSYYSGGTVFALTPSGAETTLYSFDGNGTDGSNPQSGLIRDKQGNLYGTTAGGGVYGGGTVFELTPSGAETILWNFGNGTDGNYSVAGLIVDKNGNLYGTTTRGGANGVGTVFKLTPSGAETILWNFGNGTDGYWPYAGLIRDKKGNVYGTTGSGGAYGYGTVFALTQKGTETILWNFGSGTDGKYPYGGLVFDKKGNLYGTTGAGGAYGDGTVFELTPSRTETILHDFNWDGTDGYGPSAGLVFDKKGNLYGTTFRGGVYDKGTVFKVAP